MTMNIIMAIELSLCLYITRTFQIMLTFLLLFRRMVYDESVNEIHILPTALF